MISALLVEDLNEQFNNTTRHLGEPDRKAFGDTVRAVFSTTREETLDVVMSAGVNSTFRPLIMATVPVSLKETCLYC